MLRNLLEHPAVKEHVLAVLGVSEGEKIPDFSRAHAQLAGSPRSVYGVESIRRVERVETLGVEKHEEPEDTKWRALDSEEDRLVGTRQAFAPETLASVLAMEPTEELQRIPQALPGFSRATMGERVVWSGEGSQDVFYEFISADRDNAIKRFLLQDIIAFQDSEDDYLEIGRPSKHDVWAALNYNNGLLVVACEKEKFGKVDEYINGNGVFSNGKWLDTSVFDDLLGGIYLRLERSKGKNYQRIYSLAANPNNKNKGIKNIGTNLARFAAMALQAKDNPLEDSVEALKFNFYWLNQSTQACYFANNPDLFGYVDGILFGEKKLSGVIPISESAVNEAQAYRKQLGEARQVSLDSAMDEKYHNASFAVQFPPTQTLPKQYTNEHRQMIELYEHMFSKHKAAVGIPHGLPGRKIGFGFVPRALA